MESNCCGQRRSGRVITFGGIMEMATVEEKKLMARTPTMEDELDFEKHRHKNFLYLWKR